MRRNGRHVASWLWAAFWKANEPDVCDAIANRNLWVKAAKRLGVTRQALSELVNEKTGISVEMAIRLSKAFGSSPEAWLGMQMAYDLRSGRRARMEAIQIRRFRAG